MKKIILGTLLVGATLLSHSMAEAADLNVQVKGVDNNFANQFVLRQGTTMASGFGYAPSFDGNALYRLSGIHYTLYKDGVSYQTGYTANGDLSFPGLTAGTYNLVFDDSRYVALQVLSPTSTQALREHEEYDSNTGRYVPDPIYFVGNNGEEFKIPEGADDAKLNLAFVFSAAPRGLITSTPVGTIQGGTVGASGNSGRIWYSSHFDTKTGDLRPVTALNENDGTSKLNYYLGVLIGDTYGEYNSNLYLGKGTGTDIFEEPTLSAAEKEKGYVFKGWKFTYLNNEKTNDDTIYTREQIEKMTIVADARFEAVFELPTHTVTFATNTDMGTLNGAATKTYTVDGNDSTVATVTSNTLPTPVAKDGYEFLGWYVLDNIGNLVSTDKINATTVNKDLIYYAKYKTKDSTSPSVTIISTSADKDGNTVIKLSDGNVITIPKVQNGTNGISGANGANGKDGKSITVISSVVNSDGSTKITFSDGTTVTIPKGQDGKDGQNGKDGKDGVSPSVTIAQNGNWIINGSDTGVSAIASIAAANSSAVSTNGSASVKTLPHTGSTKPVSVMALILAAMMSATAFFITKKRATNK